MAVNVALHGRLVVFDQTLHQIVLARLDNALSEGEICNRPLVAIPVLERKELVVLVAR